MSKAFHRREILAARITQPPLLKRACDVKILSRLERLPVFRTSKEFFAYLDHKGEVATSPIIQKFFGKKKIIVPKISGREICLYELHDPHQFKNGKFGIREPKVCLARRELKKIDVALIPAIAFDKTGHRIGFGGGYFDRLLKKIDCITIGLAYEFQMIEKVQTHRYDVPVNFIITEARLIQCHSSKNKIRKSSASWKRKSKGRPKALSLSLRKIT